jgi:transcriptional regulator with XRE-family HTH domain
MNVLPIGLLWKLRRVAAGLRQQDVARSVGISTTRYSAIERGEEDATEMDCILIERILPLLPRSDEPPRAGERNEALASRD